MTDILEKLKGGDRRSIGRADEVVEDVFRDPALFDTLFEGMLSDDPIIRMRAADAVEKITAEHPEYLAPHKAVLIDRVAVIDQQEVRWHVAQMVPRLALSEDERHRVVEILFGYLEDRSRIVQVNAMQALVDLMEDDADLHSSVLEAVSARVETGSPAVRSRARKLLERLSSQRR
jgi:HEAT repeat protein